MTRVTRVSLMTRMSLVTYVVRDRRDPRAGVSLMTRVTRVVRDPGDPGDPDTPDDPHSVDAGAAQWTRRAVRVGRGGRRRPSGPSRAAVGKGLAVILLTGTVSACGTSAVEERAAMPAAPSVDSETAANRPAPTRSSAIGATPGATSVPSASTAAPGPRAPNPGPGPLGVEVTLPPPGVPATGPAVVLVHGGSWVAGNPDLMDSWARALAGSGAVVFNASYRLVYRGGGYPESVDDIACAVRYARDQAPGLTTSNELVIMGHSAGAQLAAVVALNGDEFGTACPYPRAAPPDRLVGLAGIYDVRGLGPLFEIFVGASAVSEPERWTAVNPVELADQRTDLSVLLVVAGDDEVVSPAEAASFAAALGAGDLAPGDVTVETVAGAGHNDLLRPGSVALRTIVNG